VQAKSSDFFPKSATTDGGAFANGHMDAPLSDCGKKQTAERKALNSFNAEFGNLWYFTVSYCKGNFAML